MLNSETVDLGTQKYLGSTACIICVRESEFLLNHDLANHLLPIRRIRYILGGSITDQENHYILGESITDQENPLQIRRTH